MLYQGAGWDKLLIALLKETSARRTGYRKGHPGGLSEAKKRKNMGRLLDVSSWHTILLERACATADFACRNKTLNLSYVNEYLCISFCLIEVIC